MDRVILKSKYNEKLHKRFYLFHMFRKSFSVYFLFLAIGLSIYLAIKTTIKYDLESSKTNFYIAWGLAIMFISMVPTFTFGRINSIIRQNKKARGERLEIIEITKAKIVRFIEGVDGKSVLGWEHFESVYELKECFLMYIDKDRGLVLNKNDFEEGTVEMLRKLIQNNLKPNRRGKIKFKQYIGKAHD